MNEKCSNEDLIDIFETMHYLHIGNGDLDKAKQFKERAFELAKQEYGPNDIRL
jgi:hypothetical protein